MFKIQKETMTINHQRILEFIIAALIVTISLKVLERCRTKAVEPRMPPEAPPGHTRKMNRTINKLTATFCNYVFINFIREVNKKRDIND